MSAQRHQVVVIGSGFGGLFATQALRGDDVEVTLVSDTTSHLFQPLLYQVATGILSEGEIAPSTREVLSRQANARVVLGDVTDIDLANRTVTSRVIDRETITPYDSLVVAAGAGQSYFGNDRFAEFAPGLKSIDDALELRGRIFAAFELAELSHDPADIDRLLTFVVVGAGPTGVEMAGQIAELSRRTLRNNFRSIDPARSRVLLLDGADQVLSAFGDKLGQRAQNRLEELGVDVELGSLVTDMDERGLTVKDSGDGTRRIEAATKVWAAGVQASPLAKQLGEQTGADVDKSGRVATQDDLTLPGHPEVYVVGDMASLKGYPGVAQVAIQGGRYAAEAIRRRVAGQEPQGPFVYHDKGSMATISRFSAVASVKNLRFSGFFAWVLWLGVHLFYIIGFKSRVTTLLHWAVSFLGRGRAERTITEQQIVARNVLRERGAEEGGPAASDPAARHTGG